MIDDDGGGGGDDVDDDDDVDDVDDADDDDDDVDDDDADDDDDDVDDVDDDVDDVDDDGACRHCVAEGSLRRREGGDVRGVHKPLRTTLQTSSKMCARCGISCAWACTRSWITTRNFWRKLRRVKLLFGLKYWSVKSVCVMQSVRVHGGGAS